jgi:hypothetical protein
MNFRGSKRTSVLVAKKTAWRDNCLHRMELRLAVDGWLDRALGFR